MPGPMDGWREGVAMGPRLVGEFRDVELTWFEKSVREEEESGVSVSSPAQALTTAGPVQPAPPAASRHPQTPSAPLPKSPGAAGPQTQHREPPDTAVTAFLLLHPLYPALASARRQHRPQERGRPHPTPQYTPNRI